MCDSKNSDFRISIIERSHRPNGYRYVLALLHTNRQTQSLRARRCFIAVAPAVRPESSVEFGGIVRPNLRWDLAQTLQAPSDNAQVSPCVFPLNGFQAFGVQHHSRVVDDSKTSTASAAAFRRRRSPINRETTLSRRCPVTFRYTSFSYPEIYSYSYDDFPCIIHPSSSDIRIRHISSNLHW